MKTTHRIRCLLKALLICLALSAFVPVFASSSTESGAEQTVKAGWIKKGKKYYWRKADGSILQRTGRVKLGGHIYFLSKDHSRASGFQTWKNHLYFFRSKNGRLYTRTGWNRRRTCYFTSRHYAVTGLRKISGRYYLFNEKGRRQTKGTCTVAGVTYILDSEGFVEAYKKQGVYYWAGGQRMTEDQQFEYPTLLTARGILSGITDSSMSDEEKLSAAFNWVMNKYYLEPHADTFETGWTALYANDHFNGSGGTCISDACAFAYLARAIGYEVYICVDSNIASEGGHGWAEIGGLVYDPLFAQSKSYAGNYAASYAAYGLYPVVHYRLF